MKQTRWNPLGTLFTPLQQFQEEMNRLFDRWSGDNRLPGMGGYPALNIWEDTESCYVEAELPGVELKDLEITVVGGNQLVIKGERRPVQPEQGVWHRRERTAGAFSRAVELPFPVNPDKVEAKLDNGVLLIKLAKHESARPRKINVKAE
jgi:HSP20 family protein